MPQKKTRTAKYKHKPKTKTKTKTYHLRKVYDRTPTPYPFSPVSPLYPTDQTTGTITSSSSAMKAVSHDGKHWDVDTDKNGVKKHITNLTNSQLMNILAYPAAKQDLKTRLLQEFRNIPQHQQHHQHPILQRQPTMIASNFGVRVPIIRMMEGPIEEPKIEYIYKRGCSNYNKPVMINKLSPLHEARIIPESSGEPIHLVPIHTSRSGRMKVRGKGRGRGKGNGRGKSKKQNRKI
jgi:hypothetical protein